MRLLALAGIACFGLASAASAEDLGPYPDAYAPPPPERRIVEHHHYYHQPAPVYRERVYVEEPRVYYRPRVYAEAVYPRPYYAYGYTDWRYRPFYRPHWRGHGGWGHGRW